MNGRWKKFRSHIARETSSLFDGYLQKKGASGEVKFDHKGKRLALTYQKDNLDEGTRNSNVRQLSGGERSFATLALLLALGATQESPFRVMDEFDVFMDAPSRNLAVKEVIQFGLDHKERQFIFITPQDLSSVTVSDEVRIHKLRPAREGQLTLQESLDGGK